MSTLFSPLIAALFAGPISAHYLALAGCIAFTSTAQICLKAGARNKTRVVDSFLNRLTLVGYALFGATTVLSVYAMQTIDLKVVSTWTGMTFVLVTLLSKLILKESISRSKVIGCALIIAGIVIFHL
jgi:multidrug transporter EmrE-like cation transporter